MKHPQKRGRAFMDELDARIQALTPEQMLDTSEEDARTQENFTMWSLVVASAQEKQRCTKLRQGLGHWLSLVRMRFKNISELFVPRDHRCPSWELHCGEPDENGSTMSETNDTPDTKARQEIERLRLENRKLSEELLELQNSLRFHNGLAGQMQQQRTRIEQINIPLIRAADALENNPSGMHSELVQELRNAGQ